MTLIVITFFAAIIMFVFLRNFHPVCGSHSNVNYIIWNANFVAKEYSQMQDLGKSFLTIVIAVFVASITFSEKIVNVEKATSLSKTFLYLCWTLLLSSTILAGAGLAFFAGCFDQALYVPCEGNKILFNYASYCFLFAGVSFGLGLLSMLLAGINSIDRNKTNET